MGRIARQPTEAELALANQQAEAAAASIAAKYQPPETGGWSDIGDPIVLRYLLEGVALGLKTHDACLAAGISTDTLSRWLKRAEDEPNSAYAALAEAIKSAKAKGKRWHLENIQRHSITEWTASAWTLERTDQAQFALQKDKSDGPTVVFQVGVRDGDVTINQLSPVPRNELAGGNPT